MLHTLISYQQSIEKLLKYFSSSFPWVVICEQMHELYTSEGVSDSVISKLMDFFCYPKKDREISLSSECVSKLNEQYQHLMRIFLQLKEINDKFNDLYERQAKIFFGSIKTQGTSAAPILIDVQEDQAIALPQQIEDGSVGKDQATQLSSMSKQIPQEQTGPKRQPVEGATHHHRTSLSTPS